MNDKNGFVLYEIFAPFEEIIAFTTTRQTLSYKNVKFTGDSQDIFHLNRQVLSKKLGIKSNQLIFPRQTHTNCVAEIFGIPENEIQETDALVTSQPGICVCVQTADCVPVLLFDPNKKVVAAIHAGWRGTVNKIVEVAVQKMVENHGSSAKQILAAIGPSISPDIYEVGNEVKEAANKSIPNAEVAFHKNISGKFHFNLWEANRQILLENGLTYKNIEILGECSYSLPDKYFSARKESIKTGRMVSGIMIKRGPKEKLFPEHKLVDNSKERDTNNFKALKKP